MTGATLAAITSHWRRYPWQLLTLIIGLAMATALWSGVQAINAEARAGYKQAGELAQLTALPEVQLISGATVTNEDFAFLRRNGFNVTPYLSGTIDTNGRPLTLYGIDPFTHPLAPRLASSPGNSDAGIWFDREGVLLANAQTAERLAGRADLPPVRVVSGLSLGAVVADIAIADRVLGAKGLLSIGIVGSETPPDPYFVVDPPAATDIAGLTDSFHLNLTAFGALSFAVGLFILHSGIGLAIEERRASFRTLRALGVPLTTLVACLALELLIVALFAGFLGLALGYLVAGWLMPGVSATLSGLFGATTTGGLSLRPEWIVSGLALAVLGTATAGASALVKVARMPLLAPAMPRSWGRRSRRASLMLAMAGLLLLSVAGLGAIFGQGLPAIFTTLFALLLGSAFILPALLGEVLRLSTRFASRPMTRWFLSDSESQLPGLNLALMALMLAIAANIGVNTMVSSFRQTFLGFLDQRLVSDLYLTARSEAEAGEITDWASSRGLTVLPIWHIDTAFSGRPSAIYGVADHPIYRNNWPMISSSPKAWNEFRAGTGAFVSEQFARFKGLSLGDTLEIAPGWTQTVEGIYADYGNAVFQVAVNLDGLLAHHPNVQKLHFGLLTPDGEAANIRDEAIKKFALPGNALVDRNTVYTFSLRIFEQTFSVTGALNVLTLGVAGFALLTSLLTLATMRLPALAPVWALGMTRANIAMIEVIRALALTALTFLVALPVGLALAWVLLRRLNVEAFGWQLPMEIFPGDWAMLLVVSLLAALLSTALPAWRLSRISPARLTQVFANAR